MCAAVLMFSGLLLSVVFNFVTTGMSHAVPMKIYLFFPAVAFIILVTNLVQVIMAKSSQFLLWLVLTLFPNYQIATASQITATVHKSQAILDEGGKFNVSWEVDRSEDSVIFEVVAATKGYVGFGLSPTGNMAGADIFYAGVWDNGSAYHFVSGDTSRDFPCCL